MTFTRSFAKIHTPGQFSPTASLNDVNYDVTAQDYPILRHCTYTVLTPALDSSVPSVRTSVVLRSIQTPRLGAGDSVTYTDDVSVTIRVCPSAWAPPEKNSGLVKDISFNTPYFELSMVKIKKFAESGGGASNPLAAPMLMNFVGVLASSPRNDETCISVAVQK